MKPARRRAVLACLALLAEGCFGTPTPLAPAVTGSVGMPHNGVQTNPVEFPLRGDGFVRYRPHGPNYWGNPRLVRAVEQAAAEVQRLAPGGAPLVVGDFSARRGGQISGHRSHRNGRDVDLLFYVQSPEGVPTRSPGFLAFAGDGLGALTGSGPPRYLRLDVEREWLLVKELLQNEEIGVQFMFVSHEVEALLVDYALARGEDLNLIWHAETVLLQPGDSTPHADHIHLRIACTPEEAVAGCEGGGPLWEWLPNELALVPLDTEELERIAADDPIGVDTSAPRDTAAAPPAEPDAGPGGGA